MRSMIFLIFAVSLAWGQTETQPLNRARLNGPVFHDAIFQKEKSGHTLFLECMEAIRKHWIVDAYKGAQAAQIDMDMKLRIQPPRQIAHLNGEPLQFQVDLSGIALPSGLYRFELLGELGHMDLIRSPSRKMTVLHSGQSFADQPLPRSPNANLQNFYSFAMRYLGKLQTQVTGGAGYRLKYVGSGNMEGQLIDRISIAKVRKRKANRPRKKQPVPMNKIWTFWQDGQYEIWLYQSTKLPAAVFYSNPEDHIYANIRFLSGADGLPNTLIFQNNSAGFQGHSEIELLFHPNHTVQQVTFSMRTTQGHDVSFQAEISYQDQFDPRFFQAIPPFGYQKMNPDHQKLLILAQVAGQLLNLQNHGLQLKNFKF